MRNLRAFRLTSLIVFCVLMLSIVGLAAAQQAPIVNSKAALQSTESPTPIDIDTPVPLKVGSPFTTPLDNQDLTHRLFSFSGKANDIITISGQRLTGNFGFKIDVTSQNDVELGYAGGGFLQAANVIVKLPQDGNYKVRLDEGDPGSGDFSAGTVSVWITQGMPAGSPTMAATAKP